MHQNEIDMSHYGYRNEALDVTHIVPLKLRGRCQLSGNGRFPASLQPDVVNLIRSQITQPEENKCFSLFFFHVFCRGHKLELILSSTIPKDGLKMVMRCAWGFAEASSSALLKMAWSSANLDGSSANWATWDFFKKRNDVGDSAKWAYLLRKWCNTLWDISWKILDWMTSGVWQSLPAQLLGVLTCPKWTRPSLLLARPEDALVWLHRETAVERSPNVTLFCERHQKWFSENCYTLVNIQTKHTSTYFRSFRFAFYRPVPAFEVRDISLNLGFAHLA